MEENSTEMTSIGASFVFPEKPAQDLDQLLENTAAIAPHLAGLFRRHGDDLDAIKATKFEEILTSADNDLRQVLEQTRDENQVMRAIRLYRGRINHLVAMSDLLSLAPVADHLKWLSHAAETALDQTAAWLTCEENQDQNWIILGLGKLGAGELNYSSDVDLIIITQNDPDDHDTAQRYIRHTKRLTKLLSSPTADGIGWRVDLRLRPDPGATPVAINRMAAMIYYESLARTWERAAFIRARPVAGDRAAGAAFLRDLNPFIWRRYFDYSVLDDLKIMLRREKRPADLLGYNVKNGLGGIRSIEFYVHAQQLIAGGREQDLRKGSTLDALETLAAHHWISTDAKDNLKSAYLIWRRLEHRLQMIGDAQTHHLPKSTEQLTNIAAFCGHDDLTAFKDSVINLGDVVTANTADLIIRLNPDNTTEDDAISIDDARIESQLLDWGYSQPQNITTTIQGWLAGRIPATRSTRSRELMRKLLPRLLQQCAETDTPDQSFAGFARLVESLPAGLQLFSLIDSHDDIAAMIMAITLSAPDLAEEISKHPMMADALLYRDFWTPVDDWPDREASLKRAIDEIEFYEDGLSLLRRQCREWKFQVSAQLLQGVIDGERAGLDYAAIADAIIRAALPLVMKEISRRFGHIEQASLAVIALGRLGAEEMTLTSDLDLIFIYDGQKDMTSDGKKQLDGHQYFSRFSQELINALSSLTAEGRCYEVDMRLRPSGNAGPVAVHIDSFIQYHHKDAWLWEHLALVKSRVIGGINHDGLTPPIDAITTDWIKSAYDAEVLWDETNAMREKLLEAQPAASPRDIRRIEGGIMDIDLLTAMLQLRPEAKAIHRHLRSRDASADLAEIGLITSDEAQTLAEAVRFYSDLIQWIRLTKLPTGAMEDAKTALPTALPTAMAKQFKTETFQSLDQKILTMAKTISAITKKYVCKP